MVRLFQQYIPVKSILLFVVEAFLIAFGVVGAVALRFWDAPQRFDAYIVFPSFAIQVGAVVLAFQLSFYYNNLYGKWLTRPWELRLIDFGQSIGIACVALGVLYVVLPGVMLDQGVFVLALALVSAVLYTVRVVVDAAWPTAVLKRNCLILGTGALAESVCDELNHRPDLHVHVTGFVRLEGTAAGDLPSLGDSSSLADLVERNGIQTLVVATEDRRQKLPMAQLVRLRMLGLDIQEAHTMLSALRGRVCLETVQPSWFVFGEGFRRSPVRRRVKAVSDIVLAAIGLLLALPVMALVAVAIKLDSKGPILYRQRRVGFKGKVFEVLKFRSMRTDAEAGGAQWAAKEDPRVTRLGKWLRKFRLDELPQFVNVLRGDMSFVGPRPERPEFVDQLREAIPYYDERHLARPGLTGWAQVRYAYGASLEDSRRKLEYDLFYLKNMSFLFDVAIVLETVRIVLTGHGGR